MTVSISPATEIDTPKIKAFIQKVGADVEQMNSTPIQYLTAKDVESNIVAVLGTITEASTLILRHLIIDPKKCDMAMLLEIIEHSVAFGASKKVKRILFLTPAPKEMFEPLGFSKIEKDHLEEALQKRLPLDQDLPPTAKVLVRELS